MMMKGGGSEGAMKDVDLCGGRSTVTMMRLLGVLW